MRNILRISQLGEPRYESPVPYVVSDDACVPSSVNWKSGEAPEDLFCFEKAGPRSRIFFDPKTVRAGIVTCGGLSPGLNNIIRSVVLELNNAHGVPSVLGFREGFRGLNPAEAEPPVELTPALVDDIHQHGGTILGTSRGPVDIGVGVETLVKHGIQIFFVVGGDGTQRGANEFLKEAVKRGYPLAVVGIPKTIDNDISFVSRTFGFATAIDSVRGVLNLAHTESTSVRNGIAVVKVMGRNSGFIAAGATVASQDVHFCLIPEIPLVLAGEGGFLHLLKKCVAAQRHAVVVVAEGAGQDLFKAGDLGRDASGNVKLHDIGPFLCQEITSYFKSCGIETSVRYFDPSYQIRSCPAKTEDAVLCDRFARFAVHAGMAGKTGVMIGLVNGQFVHVPLELVTRTPKRLDPQGELWYAVKSVTGFRWQVTG